MKFVNARMPLLRVLTRRNWLRFPQRLALVCCTLVCAALLLGSGAWGTKAGPGPGAPPPPAAQPAAAQTRGLPVDSNATVTTLAEGAHKVSFPANGYVRCCGQNVFKDKAELHSYLAQTFPFLKREDGVLSSAVQRAGKYQRIDTRGNPIFTFGDPVLDILTNEAGGITVAGQSYDLRATEASVTSIFGNGSTEIGLLSTVQPPTPVFKPGRSFGGMIACFMARFSSCIRERMILDGKTVAEAIAICSEQADIFWMFCSGSLVDSSLP